MKVSNRKGIANQAGPESCVADREVRDEALTGEALLSSFCLLFLPLAQFPAMFADHRRLLEIMIAENHDLLGPAADCGQDRHMQHVEKHFTGGETVRDVVIGMADGLTVPFALAAGISGAIASTHIVVTAGLAEVAAGSIAMGLGGFLAAKGDAEHYESELRREENEICEVPEREAEEIVDLFKDYGVTASEAAPVVAALRREPKAWRDFMMRFELGLEAPDPKRALRSALTIAGSYVIGGMIPLLPYMLAANAHQALMVSIAVTLLALALFGFVKGHFTGVSKFKSAWQTALVGSLAAGVAFAIAKAIS